MDWTAMTARQFDTSATDTQHGLFAAGSSGELADLFTTEPEPAPDADSTRRQAVRRALERQYGRAIPVTKEMIDAVLAELPA